MASDKQIEANRINAQRSTGPKTEAGKEASKGNALKHGLRAEAIEVLPDEDAEAFAARVDAWNRDLRPIGEVEARLVRHAAAVTWKLDRADRYETAVLSRRMLDAVYACKCEEDDIAALKQAAAVTSFDPSMEGERLRRYQSSMNRELRQTLDTLLKLRKAREACANEAKSAPIEAKRANEANSESPNEAKLTHHLPVSGRVGRKPWVPPRFDSLPLDMDLLSNSTATAAWVDFSINKA